MCLILYTNQQKALMQRTSTNQAFCDGTFGLMESYPNGQVFVISADIDDIHVPLCFGLLQNKTSQCYDILFQHLAKENLLGNVETIYVDFEQNIWNSIRNNLKTPKVAGDYFHFLKANYDYLKTIEAKHPRVDFQRIRFKLQHLAKVEKQATFKGDLELFQKEIDEIVPSFAEYFKKTWHPKTQEWALCFRTPGERFRQQVVERFNEELKNRISHQKRALRLDLLVDHLYRESTFEIQHLTNVREKRHILVDTTARRAFTMGSQMHPVVSSSDPQVQLPNVINQVQNPTNQVQLPNVINQVQNPTNQVQLPNVINQIQTPVVNSTEASINLSFPVAIPSASQSEDFIGENRLLVNQTRDVSLPKKCIISTCSSKKSVPKKCNLNMLP